jgi:hypothetical protein
MSRIHERQSRSRAEVGRLVAGSLLEVGIKAYGAGAAVSVALSDAETLAGKRDDALAAVPNLAERYRDAHYIVEHRAEIQTSVDYVNQHAPDAQEVQAAADESAETLDGIERTYSEIVQAKEAFPGLNPLDWDPREAAGHVSEAWSARPDLGSIGELAEVADQVSPFVEEVEVLLPVFYGGLLTLMDNFARDEIAATILVMGAALGLAFVLGTAVGFWTRRGRPGLIARALQRWGARVYRGWYVRNPEHALGRPLYAAARERIQNDVVADPQHALDPEAFRALERYFERRLADRVSPGEVLPSRSYAGAEGRGPT